MGEAALYMHRYPWGIGGTPAAAEAYRSRIMAALPAGMKFEPLMTLYLTNNTPPDEILRAQESGIVHAVKLYPAGATTNSDAGVTDLSNCYKTLEMMQEVGMPFLVHGLSLIHI